MGYRKRTPLHDWRAMLTPEEARRVVQLERQQERAQESGKRIAAELAPIRNRAVQRCRYAAQQKSPPAPQAHTEKEAQQ